MVDATCTRMRLHISAQLDGELTEFGVLELARHLTRCSACAAVGPEIRRATELLRVTPAERPAATIAVPPRRAARARYPALAATLAALVAAVGVLPIRDTAREELSQPGLNTRAPYLESMDYELALIAAARATHIAEMSPVLPV